MTRSDYWYAVKVGIIGGLAVFAVKCTYWLAAPTVRQWWVIGGSSSTAGVEVAKWSIPPGVYVLTTSPTPTTELLRITPKPSE